MKNKSFTVIELLVVIAIIGLLASIILVSFKGTRGKAKIAKGLEFSHSIQHVLGAEAVGIWSFDDCPAGTANDASGYGNNGTIYGGASCTSDTPHATVGTGTGKYALSFDGVNDYVMVTNNMASLFPDESVTISVWFKANGAGVIVDELGQTTINTGWHDSQIEVLSTGEVRARVWNLASVSLGTVTFGAWNHAVLRYSKSALNLDGFLNGVEATTNVSGDRSAPWEAGRSLIYAFGPTDSTNLGSGAYFNGTIDEVHIYSQALSAAEIQKHYVEGLERHKNLALQEP